MSTVSEAARKQARYKEISDERKAIEEQIAQLEERDSALNREQLELLGAEFSDGKTTKRRKKSAADEPTGLVPTDKDKAEKPKRERKARGSNLGTIRESVVNGIEGIGVFPNVGTLDDVKASVITQMRTDESIWWSVTDLSKTLGIDSKLVSKAVSSFSGFEDNGLNKRAKKYRLVQAETAQADEIGAAEYAYDPADDEEE